ncbi:MAG: ABC transporter permease [Crocinitomicaceae bacterium]|nr:ABC transporter permease [Crocinitomicaceae bacterium]
MSNSTVITPGIFINRSWRRFVKNPLAMAGSFFILITAITVLAGHFIRPDKTVDANDQHLIISGQKPGFETDMIRVQKATYEKDGFFRHWLDGGLTKNYFEFPINRIDEIRGDSIVFFSFSKTGHSKKLIFAHSDLMVNDSTIGGASQYLFHRKFILGTDKYGRDLLSRLMAGAGISLSVGIIAVLISVIVGLVLGLFAGYYRGWTDKIIMWFTNVVWSIPTLLLVMAITFAFGTGFWKVFLAVGLTMWVEVARIARGQVLSVREKEYIEAARALGFSEFRIIFRHVLPNILSPIIVICAANFASAILIEAGLSFLGLGAQIPTPSWGNMIREHYAYITTDLAYLAIIPGLMIMLLVLSFMLVGNGLRDALDVKE